jgi:hypothetical protein
VLGNIRYQAPELIGAMEDVDEDIEMNEGGLADEPEIYSDKLTTKTDVYAYAVVALEVCWNILGSYRTISVLRRFHSCNGYGKPLGLYDWFQLQISPTSLP